MSYVIEGGEEGKARLNILGQAMNSYSTGMLLKAGLKQGSKCLDAGCGGGTMTYAMAEIAGPSGRVTGIDHDAEIIRLNNAELNVLQPNNITFRHEEIYDITEVGEYDIIFARFLLSHLSNPSLAINKMMAALKQGGCLVTEDVHFSGHFCYPPNQAFNTYLEWYTKAVKYNGGDAEFGAKLYEHLVAAGFQDIQLEIVQPAGTSGPAKQMSLVTLEKIRHSVLAAGLASDEEFNKVDEELKTFTSDRLSIISMPRIFQVWGRKD
jgi:ubiquinone/menaquinone biosynthesis C-methylase UbiE